MQPLAGRIRGRLRTGRFPSSSWRQLHRPGAFFCLVTRRRHSTKATQNKADAIVVGAGPAGIAAVGKLVEQYPNGNVVWIDRSFDGGSIGQFCREVPSFSPASNFLEYAAALPVFKDITDTVPQPNAVTRLQALDPNMTCSLSHAADMLQFLSERLIQHSGVKAVLGNVTEARRDSKTRQWKVTVQPNHDIGHIPHREQYHAPVVVLCTGAAPRITPLPAPVSRLTLETCLSPTRLAKLLPRDRDRVVAVLGRGYAAAVVLKNFAGLAASSHPRLRIRWVVPGPEPWPERSLLPPAGEVTEFVRAVVEGHGEGHGGGDGGGDGEGHGGGDGGGDGEGHGGGHGDGDGDGDGGNGPQGSGPGQFIERVILPASEEEAEEVLGEGLLQAGVDYAVECSSFRRARLPELRPGVAGWTKLGFDSETGSFGPYQERSNKVIGLFGAGSAFPGWGGSVASKGRDAVGMLESLLYVKRLLPAWIDATKRGSW